MKHTLDEMVGWPTCDPAITARFEKGRAYSLRETYTKLTFGDVWWYLIEKSKRDPATLNRLRRFVTFLHGNLSPQADQSEIGRVLHEVTLTAVRRLNKQGMDTSSALGQIRKEQMLALLPFFDDPDDNGP